jgi:signal transduction histidine kinase
MRRRLVMTVVATSALILIALLLPMGALVERFAFEDALAAAGLEVQATESVVAFRERADLVTFIQDINTNSDRRTTVLFADGDAIGPDPQFTPDVQQARDTGRAITNSTEDGAEILVPVDVRGVPGDLEDAADTPAEVSVIRVVIAGHTLTREVFVSWFVLALLGLGLLGLAVLVADRLGRTLVRPVTALARTAGRLERGDLTARADPGGPPEIGEVGLALNRLATRILELLAEERESAADASHRLRTPITALRLEAGELRDPAERGRITAHVDDLSRSVDALIREARRPTREGLGAATDLVALVAERAQFWRVLAEDQRRSMTVSLPPGPVLVKVDRLDLTSLVDALLDNVFSHTDEGVPFEVDVATDGTATATLAVSDHGDGIADYQQAIARGTSSEGSSGLGLDIVRRIAEASGGRLVLEATPGGGARVLAEIGLSGARGSSRTLTRRAPLA